MNACAGLIYELLPTLTAAPEVDDRGKDGLADYFHALEAELADLRQLQPRVETEEMERELLRDIPGRAGRMKPRQQYQPGRTSPAGLIRYGEYGERL